MADLDKLSIQIESNAGGAITQIEALSAAMSKLKEALGKLPATQNNAITQLSESLGGVSAGAEQAGMKKLAENMDQVSQSVRKAGAEFKRSKNRVGEFVGSLGRIAMYRGVRMILSAITSGAKQGFTNLAQYSETAAASMSKLNSVSAYLSNSLGAALGPVVSGLIPILNSLSSAISTALNWLNALFSALGGGITFTAAKDSADGLTSSLGGAGGAAKKLKQELMGFDEINSLKPDSGGGGGGGGSLGTDEMFEELPISKQIMEIAERIRLLMPIVKALGISLGSWALSSAFLANIDKVGNFLKTLKNVAAAGLGYFLSVSLTYDFVNSYTESKDPMDIIAAGISAGFGAFILGKVSEAAVPGLGNGFGAAVGLLLTAATVLKLRYEKTMSGDLSVRSIESEVMKIFSGLAIGVATGLMFKKGPAGAFGLSLTLGATTFIDNINVLKSEGNFTVQGILESEATWTSFIEMALSGALAGFMLTGGPHGALIGAGVGAGLTLVAYIGTLLFDFFDKPAVDDSAIWEYMEIYRSETPNLDVATLELAVALNLVPSDIGIDPTVYSEAQVLVDNLFALQGEDGTLNVEDSRVKAYINELNKLNISGLNEQLKVTDGRLVGTKESLSAIITLERQRAKQQAYIEVLGTAYRTLAEKILDVQQAEQSAYTARESLNTLLQQANAILQENGQALIPLEYYTDEYTGSILDLLPQLQWLIDKYPILTGELDEASGNYMEQQEEVDKLKGEYDDLADKTAKLIEALESADEALSQNTLGTVKTWASGIKGEVIGTVSALQSTIDEFAKHVEGMNPVLKIKSKISAPTITYYSNGNASVQVTPNIEYTKFAGGGIADTGSLILAGEAGPEIVGQVGNKTGVVNDTQIADIISTQMARNGGGASAGDIAQAVVNAMTGLGVYIGREQVGRVVAQAIDDNRSADGKFAYNLA